MPPVLNETLRAITTRIAERSRDSRRDYLEKLGRTRRENPPRRRLSCGNMAHAAAACAASDQMAVATADRPNIGIVTAYNDMLSAHQPYGTYPDRIKRVARDMAATAQVAGGVPAMCDGVTQGQPGMELSLFSRDVIAMATAISLSHNTFDSAMMLGVCDKIVPGLLIGALAFGHLPILFVPAGPMTTGLPNDEKTRIRKAFIAGKLDRAELLKAELRSYHGPGTCTFYGTANSNQMLMEVMGLHVPGAAFVNPGSVLRDVLTDEATRWAARSEALPAVGEMLDEKSFANAIVGLHATGGSTNHLIHLVAIARAAGIMLSWQDFADLSQTVPLLARIYPNGPADVNQFHAAGGLAFIIRELLEGGLLHPDARTLAGDLRPYAQEPWLRDGELAFRDAPARSLDETILRPVSNPFEASGGLAVVSGNLGQAVVKISAVAEEHQTIRAPARLFHDVEGVQQAYRDGTLAGDCVIVLRFQGPRANGMPELHALMPVLGLMQDRGQRVALLSDGRLSGASGKILSAIHLTPEAAEAGPLARLRDGDIVTIDAARGLLLLEAEGWESRPPAPSPCDNPALDLGRQLFGAFRDRISAPTDGASVLV